MVGIASLLHKANGLGSEPSPVHGTTADYFILLSRAVEGLPNSTRESRAEIYQSARNALSRQLKATNPPVPKSRIAAEQRALDDAVESVEARAIAQDTEPVASEREEPGTSPDPTDYVSLNEDESMSRFGVKMTPEAQGKLNMALEMMEAIDTEAHITTTKSGKLRTDLN